MLKRLLFTAAISLFVSQLNAVALQTAKPESQGYSSQRLERLHTGIQAFMNDGRYAGAVTLIARNGKVVDQHTYGYQDLASKTPMKMDSIFRIFSMTKGITSVCILQLYEEGKLDLNDPVSKFIPEMAQMKVYAGGTTENPVLEDQEHVMTVRELLTHTSGIPYAFTAGKNLEPVYNKNACLMQKTSSGFIHELVKCPLVFQPGTEFLYGMSVDVLGVVVERISGLSLADYMQKNVFEPLGMEDTAFAVPQDKLNRLVTLYTRDQAGLKPHEHKWDTSLNPIVDPNSKGGMICGIYSGGAGLYSTIRDYYAFAQMLLNKGEYNGQRLLSPRTVEFMTANHLEGIGDGTHMWSDYEGFGLGVEVRIKYADGKTLGSLGNYGWDGAASTYYKVDPVENAVEMIFLQYMPYDPYHIFQKFHVLHYQSMVK